MRQEETFHADLSRDSLVAEAADEYERLLEKGQRPDLDRFVRRYPQVADVLRRVLPALSVMEQGEAEQPGRELGDFQIGRELGRGGMGVVYEAQQLSLNRHVALKVLPFAAVMDPRQLQRFKNEAQAAANLHHTHIVPVYSTGCERGVHYYAMQYIEGPTIAEVIEQLKTTAGRDVPPSSASALEAITSGKSTQTEGYCRSVARLGIQAAEALDHAHQQGVVHRDIKPANLIVDAGGHLWITDFGLASFSSNPGLTMTGDIVGTVRYMSPEQALAKRVPVDHRTDIYSLGITLYELLTLKGAFEGDDPHCVIQEIAFKEPKSARSLNPAVPDELETILIKAMAKSPDERYVTAQDLANDLDRYLENRPIHAKRPGILSRTGKWARRHTAMVVAAAAAMLLIAAGAAVATALVWREKERAEDAYLSETEERRRAEANLQLAVTALDEIYLDEAESVPKLRAHLSQDLLERGLKFYEGFAVQNAGSSAAAIATARAHHSAGLIYRRLGRTQLADKALSTALDGLRRLIRRDPGLAPAHYQLGNVLSTKGRFHDAIEAYREAIRVKPDFHEAHYNLGNALHQSGEVEDAIAEFREAIRLKPEFAEARTNLGNCLRECGQVEDAIAAYREAIRVKPDLHEAHFSLGGALAIKGRFDEAIAAYREGIRLKPELAEAHFQLAHAFDKQGRINKAIAAYREAIRLKDDYAEARTNLGFVLHRSGEVEDAIAEYREAIRLKPELAEAHSNLGAAFRQSGQVEDAIAEYREAIRLKPDYFEARYNLGLAFAAKGRLDEAIAAYREAIRLKPDYFEARYNLGLALATKGRLDEAIAAYREVIRLKPDHVRAHNALAWLRATAVDEHVRDVNEAVTLAARAVKLQPRNAALWNTLGVAQYRARDWKAALAALQESMRLLSGGDGYDWFFVAMAVWESGRKEEARRWYDRAVAWMKEHNPEDPELRRFRAEAKDLLAIK
ncbi:MAG: tetratricopeptide repeat protein [Planctomycetota bacterium]|jgi:tetratricopeptide (TPR) repeat protein/tRNA A-37 threonylcarbamoyl transferase component Bud32